MLHGVNAVYKRAPFELYPAPGKPWNFTPADARTIGRPGHAQMLNQSTAATYLDNLIRTVDLLGQYHIYTLLDMHQDMYNQAFRGEGAPSWAVCTGNQPSSAWEAAGPTITATAP